MSVAETNRPLALSSTHFTIRFPWWRALVLGVLLAISLVISLILIHVSPLDPNSSASIVPILQVWSYAFLPYAAACVLVLLTRSSKGRWRWVELGLILVGALILRAMLLPLPPSLSHDAWRYVWDARIFLRGYSPYTTTPEYSAFKPLQDFLFAYSRFRNAPSIYPPGAQFVFALSYLLVPSSLYFLKGVFLLFDLVSCIVLAILLVRKGMDPARLLLYAWCPLPIVEFALQGHVDVLTITFCLLSVLAASNTSYRGRALTGFLIGMATLAKLYPILLLVTIVRLREWRRDWLLVLTCLLTIVLAYLPFYIMGNGNIFGFFGDYTTSQGGNAGIVHLFLSVLAQIQHVPLKTLIAQQDVAALLLLVGGSVTVFCLRQSERISIEAGILVLFGLVLAISSHVFPWYATALLPWIVLLMPASFRVASGDRLLLVARLLALCAPWIFTCVSIVSYWQDWDSYYRVAYVPLVLELVLAAVIYLCARFWRKGTIHERSQSLTSP